MSVLQDPIFLLFLATAAYFTIKDARLSSGGLILGMGGVIVLADYAAATICNHFLIDYETTGVMIFLLISVPSSLALLAFYRYVFFSPRRPDEESEG